MSCSLATFRHGGGDGDGGGDGGGGAGDGGVGVQAVFSMFSPACSEHGHADGDDGET